MAASQKLAFIGAGNMAKAILKGALSKGIAVASNVTMSSPSGPSDSLRELGVNCMRDNALAVADADMVILCVKPHFVATAIASFAGSIRAGAVVVSVAAGVTTVQLEELLVTGRSREGISVIRVMPNVASAIGQGASAMCLGKQATPVAAAAVLALFQAVGTVTTVREAQMDAVTGLSGSGPAFVLMFIEALADGGVAAGLPRDVALSLATATVRGAAALVAETGQHPAPLRDSVASPGGTTIAGMHALERGGMRGAVMDAVTAAAKRATELRG